MKTNTEIRNWLLENAVNGDGNLILTDLDFSDFDGNVFIDGMKVKRNLFQYGHEVNGNLHQNFQKVKGDLNQNYQEVQGDLYNQNSQYGGEAYENTSTKLLKVISPEELAEMGYKLGYIIKGEN